jgi:hypothetical protein
VDKEERNELKGCGIKTDCFRLRRRRSCCVSSAIVVPVPVQNGETGKQTRGIYDADYFGPAHHSHSSQGFCFCCLPQSASSVRLPTHIHMYTQRTWHVLHMCCLNRRTSACAAADPGLPCTGDSSVGKHGQARASTGKHGQARASTVHPVRLNPVHRCVRVWRRCCCLRSRHGASQHVARAPHRPLLPGGQNACHLTFHRACCSTRWAHPCRTTHS